MQKGKNDSTNEYATAPAMAKPLSANSGSSAAVQMLVSSLLGAGIAVVPGSVQYTGATAASGLFINGGTNLETSISSSENVFAKHVGHKVIVKGNKPSGQDGVFKVTSIEDVSSVCAPAQGANP